MLKSELQAVLAPVHQEHLLKYWEELSAESQKKLATQIQAIDWPAVLEYTKIAGTGLTEAEKARIIPAPYKPSTPETAEDRKLYPQAIARGEELLRKGQVAAFTVAGGQGTRLGYDGPKGTYLISPIRNKSLFQLFAEGILRQQKRYQSVIPWYLMTSVINDRATRQFFQNNNYFGLEPSQVKFFSQGMLPAFDLETGKALLEAKDSLALSPNGHGGSLMALKSSGALEDMRSRGITTITYWQVDNPMIRPFDPLFLGLHDLTGSDMSSRALMKRDAAEKLGHFCLIDGKMTIIEYSDMPSDMLQRTDADGRLSFRAGSPAIHMIRREFIERLTSGKLEMLPHRALKKVPHLDADGVFVKPDAPNAMKLEFFIFDALPMAHSPLVLEGDRAEEFSPVKNPDGNDSPATTRASLTERAARWIEAAGLAFPRKADGTPDAVVELSPAWFDGAEDVKAHAEQLAHIQPGDFIYIGD